MYYVYLLQSMVDGSFYTGYTSDLRSRIRKHNGRSSRYTSIKVPFKLVWYCAFVEKGKAVKFEKYLKHGSGFAFAKRRLI